jgi:hypothetical protein
MTISTMTLGIMTPSTMALGIMTFGIHKFDIMTPNIPTVGIMTLRIMTMDKMNTRPWKSYCRGRHSTVDLLVLTNLYQLLSILKILFTFFKTSYLNEEVNLSEPSPSVRLP